MKLFGMTIIEHPDLAMDEAWIIFKKDAPQVPQDLRDKLSVPCILTGNVSQAKHLLTLLHAIGAPRTKAATAAAAAQGRLR